MSNKIISLFMTAVMAVALAGCLGNSEEAKRNEEPAESPKIIFSTSEGDFTIQLYPNNAPLSCEKFTMWCKGVTMPNGQIGESLYLGLQFYRVLPGKFIEGGDPFNRGQGADVFRYPFEKTYKMMTRGRVCMSNDGAGNNSSIFFILLTDNPKLQGMYTVFGEVTLGLDVADRISNVPTGEADKTRPLTPVMINGVRVDE